MASNGHFTKFRCFEAKKSHLRRKFAVKMCIAPQNYFGIWKLVLLLSNNRDIIVVFLSPCSRLSLEKVENPPCLSLEKVYRADSFLFLVSYICLVSLNKNFNNCLTVIYKFVFLH